MYFVSFSHISNTKWFVSEKCSNGQSEAILSNDEMERKKEREKEN